MRMPNLSFMVRVSQLRAIQARYEEPDCRNPDDAAVRLLSFAQRFSCMVRGRLFLGRMRAQPFYPFLLARTRYYDRVFLDAIEAGVGSIVNIGCGSDTRAERFRLGLTQRGIQVLECDQAEAIEVKRRVATRSFGHNPQLSYQAIDLNDEDWPELREWLDAKRSSKVLVMLEGVSPYVSTHSFESFLYFLHTHLAAGSLLVYDFKHDAAPRDFGRNARTQQPFRLRADRDAVAAFHALHGWQLEAYGTSTELTQRLAARLAPLARPAFDEDCLIRLSRAGRKVQPW